MTPISACYSLNLSSFPCIPCPELTVFRETTTMVVRAGREFLAIPGPTNMPDEVLQAMHRPALDIYSDQMIDLTHGLLRDLSRLFATKGSSYIYIANGHGAWEAALSNVLSRGDKVLVLESGRFAIGWGQAAAGMGAEVEVLKGDWRRAIRPAEMEAWGIDVAMSGSQKGLMTPPGLGFVAANDRARQVHKTATLRTPYWDWTERDGAEHYRKYAGTAPVHLLFALRKAVDMLFEEKLDNVFLRHRLLCEAVRREVAVWGEGQVIGVNFVISCARIDTVM